MNKRMTERVKKTVINTGRLDDNRELYPLEWLLKNIYGAHGYLTNLDTIKGAILCMDKDDVNYVNLSPEEKLKVEVLIAHSKIVDTVILTVFQWFGTNVGKCKIGVLMDEIRKLKYEGLTKNDDEIKSIYENPDSSSFVG